eukprot:135584-Amphidinium_carterae.1
MTCDLDFVTEACGCRMMLSKWESVALDWSLAHSGAALEYALQQNICGSSHQLSTALQEPMPVPQ